MTGECKTSPFFVICLRPKAILRWSLCNQLKRGLAWNSARLSKGHHNIQLVSLCACLCLKSLVYASLVVKLEGESSIPHACWTWIHVWNLLDPAKCGSICRGPRWLNRTVAARTTSAARQSPQNRKFRCNRVSPTSTPAFCYLWPVCVCLCVCAGAWLSIVNLCSCNSMSFIICYPAINLSAVTVCFPCPCLWPLHLYGWLTGYILWEQWWWWVSCRVRFLHELAPVGKWCDSSFCYLLIITIYLLCLLGKILTWHNVPLLAVTA